MELVESRTKLSVNKFTPVKKKKKCDELSQDDWIHDGEKKFQVEIYWHLLDIWVSHLEEVLKHSVLSLKSLMYWVSPYWIVLEPMNFIICQDISETNTTRI